MATVINHQQVAVADATWKQLRTSLRGALVLPGDEGYDDARRIWNGMIDRRPGAIVRCGDVADVARAVNFAHDHGLLLAVRGGGHSLPGLSVCDGGLMIDLSPMKGVTVDPDHRRARVEAGVTWGEFDQYTHTFGLAMTGGMVTHTGVAGLSLGGGLGWLMRRYGLVCDNLVSAQVVTADGRILTASADENSDLFWGLRGGGGNFGVVTSFEYELHPLSSVYGGLLAYPLPEGGAVLRRFRDWVDSAPDELMTTVCFLTSPEGHPALGIGMCYAGDPAAGEALIEPLRRMGTVVLDKLGPMPYPALQSMLDDLAEPGRRYYVRANFTDGISDDLIDAVVERFPGVPSPLTLVLIFQMGGAVSRVAADATAFAHRDAAWSFEVFSAWTAPEDDDANVGWLRDTWDTVRPFLGRGVYVNALDRGEGQERVKEAYGPQTYDRLAALKRSYDPRNLFSLNQNIDPAN